MRSDVPSGLKFGTSCKVTDEEIFVISRKIGHIWVGPHPAPDEWMDTWRQMHPDWSYTLYDNDFLLSRQFRNQPLVNEYVRRGKWAGVSDLIRYEILYEQGGFLPEADSICLTPVDELFQDDLVYTVYEFPNGATGMMSPFLAAPAGAPLLDRIITELGKRLPEELTSPWHSTGNGFLRRYFAANRKDNSEIRIFPSHLFIPEHYKGHKYTGPDKIYARQMWGSTTRSYPYREGFDKEIKAEADRKTRELYEALVARDAG